ARRTSRSRREARCPAASPGSAGGPVRDGNPIPHEVSRLEVRPKGTRLGLGGCAWQRRSSSSLPFVSAFVRFSSVLQVLACRQEGLDRVPICPSLLISTFNTSS